MIRFKLYGGQSVDGRGPREYLKTTTDVTEAKKHYDIHLANPYSTGGVIVQYDDKEDEYVAPWTDWKKLGL